jgi:hypothetical protein
VCYYSVVLCKFKHAGALGSAAESRPDNPTRT